MEIDLTDWQMVHEGMIAVVNAPNGTGRSIRSDDYLIAGKSGTSQVYGKIRFSHSPVSYAVRGYAASTANEQQAVQHWLRTSQAVMHWLWTSQAVQHWTQHRSSQAVQHWLLR